jgi:hypothetical protein
VCLSTRRARLLYYAIQFSRIIQAKSPATYAAPRRLSRRDGYSTTIFLCCQYLSFPSFPQTLPIPCSPNLRAHSELLRASRTAANYSIPPPLSTGICCPAKYLSGKSCARTGGSFGIEGGILKNGGWIIPRLWSIFVTFQLSYWPAQGWKY